MSIMSGGGFRLAAAVTAAALVLVACVGTQNGTGQNGNGQNGIASGAFPVTVEHKYGTTEVESEPKRVVTLGLSDQDAVLAMGTKPVGVVDWFKERPFGKWPWAQPSWGDTVPEIVGERDEYNFEKIAALRPDLILAQYSGMKKEQFDTLSKIAPVVAQPPDFDDYAAPWQDSARLAGKALGKSDRVERLVEEMADRFAAQRTANPAFAGREAVVADSFQPGTYSLFSPSDPKMLFMTELGFAVPEKVREVVGKENVVDFSYERFDVVDVDLLVWLTSDPAAQARITGEQLYRKLRVVQDKRDLFVSYEEPPVGAAISFNTVLSIPYALDQLVPQLAAKTR